MKTPNTIPLFSLVCLLAVLAQGANTSLTNSHARRSIERAHHNHQRHAHAGPRRLDSSDVASTERRNQGKRLDLDLDLNKVANALFSPSGTATATETSSSATDTSSSTSSSVSSTDSASSTSVTSSVTSTASATDSTTSSASTASTSSATSSPAVTDSATSTASVSDSPSPTVSDPPTSASDSASATVTDPPATVSDSPSATVSDPPASTTAQCDPLDLLCHLTTAIFPSDSSTSDAPVSTPAPTSDPGQTDSATPTLTVTDPPVSNTDAPTSTSDAVSDIINTLSSLLPTSILDPTESATPTDSNLPTQTDSSTPTQSDQPTDSVTQSDQPTQTDTATGTQTISQPPPTNTDSFSNTRTITGSDSPTDSATESVTRTESVSFPTLTDSPTDSMPTATATDSSASDSATDSASLSLTTQPIPSEYSYITDSSLALTSLPATPTLSLTLTDPDAAFTTASLTQSGTAAPSQVIAFPTQLPTRIFPANRLDPNDPALDGMALVSLKFLNGLSWSFVVNNANTAALLFVYTPQAVANALGIDVDKVLTFAMQAFAPADYNGDISQLSTVYLMYLPVEQVDALQQQLLTPNSPLYANQAGIPKQISQQLDATFPVNAVGLDTSIVGTGNSGNGNNAGAADASAASRRDAIIGVCAAFGVILLAVVVWWGYKSWKRRQDRAHRRLTHDSAGMHQAGGYGATTQTVYGGVYGVAPQRSGYAQPHTPVYTTGGAPIANPFEDSSYEEDPDMRRRSFFYAEDSLRGYSIPREEDQGITYTQLRQQQQGLTPNDGKRRAPIQASAISAPILRESSLNW